MQIRFAALLFIILFAGLFAFTTDTPSQAATTLPTKMNFQGRITNAGGNILANGTYNMRFKIWSAASGGTQQWSEDRLVIATQGVVVTNGQFSVQLGSVTSLPASIFTSNSLYFEVELPTVASATTSSPVWTEGAMTPRNQLATSAYAYNAETLDGIDGDAFAQLGTAGTFTAAQNVNVSNANAFQVRNGATNLFNVSTSGSSITIGQADTTGALLVLDTKTDTGDPTGSNGAMYYNSNSNKFRCYQNGAWADCIAAGGSATLQNVYDNSGSPATITTTAAKGVTIAAGAAPTTNMFMVSNVGRPIVTNDVNGAEINYVGGAGAIEAAGMRVDYTPGGTSGSQWSGMRIVANTTGAANGVTANGIKLEGPTTPGLGTDTAVDIGTGWDIGIDIESGGIQLAAQSDPAAPAAGNLRIYVKDIAGRMMPKWIGPSGVDTPFQASLGFNRIAVIQPGTGTAAATATSGFGTGFTNVGGAFANPAPAATNLMTSTRRTTFSSGATAGTVSSHRQGTLMVWRGNAANRGGFFYTTRFGLSALQTGNRAFVGMIDSVAAPTNVDPLTSTASNKVGMAINANTGNWTLIHNAAATAPTQIALGANFPINTTDLYELVLYSAQNGSSIGYRVTNVTTSTPSVPVQTSGSISTNMPSSTTFLAPMHWITNNATAAAATFDFGGWYLESDF